MRVLRDKGARFLWFFVAFWLLDDDEHAATTSTTTACARRSCRVAKRSTISAMRAPAAAARQCLIRVCNARRLLVDRPTARRWRPTPLTMPRRDATFAPRAHLARRIVPIEQVRLHCIADAQRRRLPFDFNQFANPFVAARSSTNEEAKRQRLVDLFEPPHRLLFNGSFDQVFADDTGSIFSSDG